MGLLTLDLTTTPCPAAQRQGRQEQDRANLGGFDFHRAAISSVERGDDPNALAAIGDNRHDVASAVIGSPRAFHLSFDEPLQSIVPEYLQAFGKPS